jgi:hypothetical protein
MLRASVGGGAATSAVYRHPVLAAMSELVPAFALDGRGPRRVGWTLRWLVAVAVLIALDTAPAITDRFENSRRLLGRSGSGRRPGATYQGFMKALARHGAALVYRLASGVRTIHKSVAGTHWLLFGWAVFAADGSKFDAPRTLANEAGLGAAGRIKCGPQMLVTLLFHLGTGLIWDWRVGRADGSERGHLRGMLSALPRSALIVMDAGFVGFDLLDTIIRSGRHVLIRVGRNAELLTGLGYAERERDGTVYLWPAREQRRRRPLVLRLVKIEVKGKEPVWLVTSVTDHTRLSDAQGAALYRMRWGVEVCYRRLKQQLDRRKMRCASPRRAVLELHWTIIGLLLLALLGVREITRRGRSPVSWSLAAALRAVRLSLREPAGPRPNPSRVRRLLAALGRAVKDSYARAASKKAWRWPHKKTPHHPGPPVIRPATRLEISLARSISAQGVTV